MTAGWKRVKTSSLYSDPHAVGLKGRTHNRLSCHPGSADRAPGCFSAPTTARSAPAVGRRSATAAPQNMSPSGHVTATSGRLWPTSFIFCRQSSLFSPPAAPVLPCTCTGTVPVRTCMIMYDHTDPDHSRLAAGIFRPFLKFLQEKPPTTAGIMLIRMPA